MQSLLGRCSSLTHLSLAATDCSLDTVSPNPMLWLHGEAWSWLSPWGFITTLSGPFWGCALSEFSLMLFRSSLGRWSMGAVPVWSTWISPKTCTHTGEPRAVGWSGQPVMADDAILCPSFPGG